MKAYQPYLNWIDEQHKKMCELLYQWASINSGSMNLAGLAQMSCVLQDAFYCLDGEIQEIELPPVESVDSKGKVIRSPLGRALQIQKRPTAPLQVFLGGHMDTVFEVGHPFQQITEIDANTWNGPGVADLKGGLIVILKALSALEQSPFAKNIGWEVLVNPDEEIGSHGTAPLFEQVAQRTHLGLVFEPSVDAQGTLAGQRKGSGSFTAVVHGKAAHSGREFHVGRNAICALADFIASINALNEENPDIILNVGNIEGGGPVNMVPDLAICRFNIRTSSKEDETWVQEKLDQIIDEINRRDGISLRLQGYFNRKPKHLTPQTKALFELVRSCGKELGLSVHWKATGGCCDGNNLADAGLPNVDTLGVRGGKIHTSQEYILLDSLTERARLTALLLMKLASGEVDGQKLFEKK